MGVVVRVGGGGVVIGSEIGMGVGCVPVVVESVGDEGRGGIGGLV